MHRVAQMTSQAGGKGVNISRAAVGAGLATIAVLPALPDDPFVHELVAAGIDCRPSRPAGDIRVNLTLTEPDGTTTKLNGPGAAVDAAHLEDLAETLVRHAAGGSWTVLAGSLPPGAPADVLRRPGAAAARGRPGRGRHQRGAAGRAGRPASRGRPDLLKPNAEELASVTGTDAERLETDPTAAAKAARTLVDLRRLGADHPRRARREFYRLVDRHAASARHAGGALSARLQSDPDFFGFI